MIPMRRTNTFSELLAFVGAPLRSSEKVRVNVSDFKNMLFDITGIELLPGFVDDHVEIK